MRERIKRQRERQERRRRRSARAVDARRTGITVARLDLSLLEERLGLFVIIVLGEAVAQLVSAAGGVDWTAGLLGAGLASFELLVGLWWLTWGAFGSGYVWVALYHQSTIVRVDPDTNRILGPPIGAGFPTEPLASAGGHLWAIPSTGGYLADPQLHTVLEIDARSGRVVSSYRTRGRPQDLVAAGDSVWVATTEPNELVRFSSSGTP
jgi:hypothetical protein